jgi:glutamyl-tRNA synthetase
MGGVRTALFNYLFAKKNKGTFLLRIEDTDQTRFVPGAEEYIMESLRWCGIEPEESPAAGGPFAPYRQSERKEKGIYAEEINKLIQSGHAYYAFDTSEELDGMRKKLEQEKSSNQQYNALTRMSMRNSLSLPSSEIARLMSEGVPYVIRLKTPDENTIIKFHDLIRGDVEVYSHQIDDKVLIKSDGMPTYHFAHIVDDRHMQISHIIRGEEWLPSAPAHVLIWRALGWEMPALVHLPLLLKPDGNGKLSKRDGDRLGFPVFPLEWKDPVSGEISSGYRERGYFPEAFVNMLAFLGWNPGTEEEIFSIEELADHFSFEHVHKSGAKFDPEKAIWFNAKYLHARAPESLAENLAKEISRQGIEVAFNERYLIGCIHLLRDRVSFEKEMFEKGRYLFLAPEKYDEAVIEKRWNTNVKVFFEVWAEQCKSFEQKDAAYWENEFKNQCSGLRIKPGEVLQLFRVLISGEASGVDLFPMAALLGGKEVSSRIEKALLHPKMKTT